MIDSAGDFLEPLLKGVGKIIGWTIRLTAEALIEALPDLFGGVFNFYTGDMERRGWPAWVYVPIALLLTPVTLLLPFAFFAAIGAAAFYALS